MATRQPGIGSERFEALRDTLAIAARRMSKEQIHELADHLFAALRRKADARSWPRARDGGTAGFT